MDFSLLEVMDDEISAEWVKKYFHPQGFGCSHCGARFEQARFFRANSGSGLSVYRCRQCQGIYHLYSGTIFEGSQLSPSQVVLLLRGFVQGQSSEQLARELGMTPKTVLKWRHRVQANAERMQPKTPVPDPETESDEMFQNAGEKRQRTLRP
jgi:transposase-like protein